jgi:hypothetical protein
MRLKFIVSHKSITAIWAYDIAFKSSVLPLVTATIRVIPKLLITITASVWSFTLIINFYINFIKLSKIVLITCMYPPMERQFLLVSKFFSAEFATVLFDVVMIDFYVLLQ